MSSADTGDEPTTDGPSAGASSGPATDELGLEVPEGDAAEQSRSLVDDPEGVEREMRNRGGDPLERVTDPIDPVNEADAADQARVIDDDEGYDDRR